jgi:hypothetical protein
MSLVASVCQPSTFAHIDSAGSKMLDRARPFPTAVAISIIEDGLRSSAQ